MLDQLESTTVLLEPRETAEIITNARPSVVRDLIKKNSGIKIASVFTEFRNRFFDKTETPAARLTYRKYKLLCVAPDGPILEELGGERKVVGPFAAVFALLQRQPNGESGFLQTNGYANIFYATDDKKELCAIRIGWTEEGWVVDAMSVADPLAWHGEHLIFCPV